jgi:hypothetical protein
VKRLLQVGQDQLDDGDDLGVVLDRIEQQQELVAADARQHVAFSQALSRRLRAVISRELVTRTPASPRRTPWCQVRQVRSPSAPAMVSSRVVVAPAPRRAARRLGRRQEVGGLDPLSSAAAAVGDSSECAMRLMRKP